MASKLTVGQLQLGIGNGYELISFQQDPDFFTKFVTTSPDYTVYHSPEYIDFARQTNGAADLIGIGKSGNIVMVIPVHPQWKNGFTTGYSGILLPPELNARILKRQAALLKNFFNHNPHIRRVVLYQSFQSSGSLIDDRRNAIDYILASPGFRQESLFSRILALRNDQVESDDRTVVRNWSRNKRPLSLNDIGDDLFAEYEVDVRNQIRQADRHGLKIQAQLIERGTNKDFVRAAYKPYVHIHEKSWMRTGMVPHSLDYWTDLSVAITQAGGIDMIITAVDGEKTVAGVTSHLYGKQAIYWSSCSLPQGLKKRANPLCLHSAVSLCRRWGIGYFEIGRFGIDEPSKVTHITHYKSQFGGKIYRLPNARKQRTLRIPRIGTVQFYK